MLRACCVHVAYVIDFIQKKIRLRCTQYKKDRNLMTILNIETVLNKRINSKFEIRVVQNNSKLYYPETDRNTL